MILDARSICHSGAFTPVFAWRIATSATKRTQWLTICHWHPQWIRQIFASAWTKCLATQKTTYSIVLTPLLNAIRQSMAVLLIDQSFAVITSASATLQTALQAKVQSHLLNQIKASVLLPHRSDAAYLTKLLVLNFLTAHTWVWRTKLVPKEFSILKSCMWWTTAQEVRPHFHVETVRVWQTPQNASLVHISVAS